jgi:hypothetical protein
LEEDAGEKPCAADNDLMEVGAVAWTGPLRAVNGDETTAVKDGAADAPAAREAGKVDAAAVSAMARGAPADKSIIAEVVGMGPAGFRAPVESAAATSEARCGRSGADSVAGGDDGKEGKGEPGWTGSRGPGKAAKSPLESGPSSEVVEPAASVVAGKAVSVAETAGTAIKAISGQVGNAWGVAATSGAKAEAAGRGDLALGFAAAAAPCGGEALRWSAFSERAGSDRWQV